jgi:hypothetical protein
MLDTAKNNSFLYKIGTVKILCIEGNRKGRPYINRFCRVRHLRLPLIHEIFIGNKNLNEK